MPLVAATHVEAVGDGKKSERRSNVELDEGPPAAGCGATVGGAGGARKTAVDPQQNSRPASAPPAVEGVAAEWKTAAGVRKRGGCWSNRRTSGAKFEGTVLGGVTTETVFKGEP